MTWKVVNNSDAGTATVFGGNDLDKISNLLNGVSNVDTISINSSWTFQNGKLTIQGNLFGRAAKTANYSAVAGDSIIECDANGGAFTITLPTAVGITGQVYNIKRADSGTSGIGNLITIATTSAQTIDGVTPASWLLPDRRSEVWIYSDGANWQTLSYNGILDFQGYRAKGSTLNRLYSAGITGAATSTQVVVAGTLTAVPFIVSKITTFDTININVVAAGAGSLARAAIYADNGNMYPGALIAGSDVGTFDTTAIGVKTNTFASAITLQPGLYWLAFNCQATAPTVSGFPLGQHIGILGSTNANPPVPGIGWSVALAFGAMPSTFTAGGTAITTTNITGCPFLRATA